MFSILKVVNIFVLRKRLMAVFTQVRNPMTGQNEWASNDDEYDYHQEVANAGFGDMLHDKERNEKYYLALRKTISKLHGQGKEAHVLDIGTGTGILSMMAVCSGANSVTACEAFLPMANCAETILEANGMKSKVHLIKKRSTDIKMGEDMKRKANVLVSEVLDTELIGEGAIGIYNHAHDHLLTDDVICIPSKANCYAQVISSSLAAQWNSLKILPNLDGDVLLRPPPEIVTCKGEANLHDVQLSQLPLDAFRPLAPPLEIFQFDFGGKKSRETKRERAFEVKSCSVGSTDLVFYWWEILMDIEGDIKLSCAPFWAHPDLKYHAANTNSGEKLANVLPWRDHWMQAIYYLPKPLNVQPGETFSFICNHDEYSLWFDVFPQAHNHKTGVKRHECSCSMHMTYSRTRIGQMNQAVRNKRFIQYLEERIKNNMKVLVLGDGCLVGLACSTFGAEVFFHEPHRHSRHFMEKVVKYNQLKGVTFIEKLAELPEDTIRSINCVFSEPYFLTSILPWDNFYFGTLLTQISKNFSHSVEISPRAARIFCMPVEFLNLHKIRTPVKECEGFDLRLFDAMVEKSMSVAHAKVEAQPLWEYPCIALAKPQLLLEVVFKEFEKDHDSKGNIPIEFSSRCNGIALWVDWLLDDTNSPKSTVTSGPLEDVGIGQFVRWDMFVRQGVHLFSQSHNVTSNESFVEWNVDFKPKQGILNFHFEVKTNK
ncbi:protein arginine N-methyltransferase 7 [Stomoxys calcitrans]|uniref:Protein arginine N-methyltransferase n=1 Tax=Stomoxys calcitrans TaxID=35570 RepID=A0A1I8P928_STOCA|nr:protein arginine N-methyltransferase 7 [Stomoxys calcitrans]